VHEVGDGALELVTVGGEGKGEGLAGDLAGAALVGAGDALASGVVVVAEGLAAKGGRSAAVGIWESVGAADSDVGNLGCSAGAWWAPPLGYFLWVKSSCGRA
jgi:hypothetical protein